MLLPYEIGAGYYYDLRIIPLLVSFLYGGPWAGLTTTVVFILFRAYIGGEGFWVSLVIVLPVLLIGYLCTSAFSRSHRGKRIAAGVALSMTHSAVFAFIYSLYHPGPYTLTQLQKYGTIALIQAGSAALVFYLIEEMLRNHALRLKFWQAEKTKVVNQLAASVSHEVRNPLTVTAGFLQLLKQHDLPAEKRDLYIQVALDELKKAEGIVSDYLSLTHAKTTVNQTLDLRKEAEACLTLLGPFAKLNGVQMISYIAAEGIYIRGNEQKLRQCLINVMKNGIEAMPHGGKLVIDLAPGKHSREVVITITDTGIGMDEEQIKHLGSPFYAHAGKGTGLGLMVAYSIIDAMEGSVFVDSTVGEGTTFAITFPIVKDKPRFPLYPRRSHSPLAAPRKLRRMMELKRTPDRS
ncbi:sporulation kinase [Xylanibacillus composti]|uniref:histidine kinase n=2 Tax=Xylanibacillus composti TaxID=1572762 RepID=A0A8J4H2M3_9BACL|nr:sporulation kinase [Xylanibacillus composti]